MELTLVRPDDWHLHVRDGAALQDVVPHTARQFKRAIIMPNLKPPVTTTEQALAYRERVLAAAPADSGFTPLMTLYLTDNTSAGEIRRAKQSGHIHAVKLYPAGATTHSDAGVTRISHTYAALEAMAELGLPLLVHAEVTDSDVDVFGRHPQFIARHRHPLAGRAPPPPPGGAGVGAAGGEPVAGSGSGSGGCGIEILRRLRSRFVGSRSGTSARCTTGGAPRPSVRGSAPPPARDCRRA